MEDRARGVGRQYCRRLHARLKLRVELAFDLRILNNGLDYQIGVRHAAARDIRHQAIHSRLHQVRLLETFAVHLRCALNGWRDALGIQVLQCHAQAAHCAPCRDVAPHGPGAYHVYPFDSFCAALAQRFKAILQLENAYEIGGGRMLKNTDDRSRMSGWNLAHITAEVVPQIDDGVGRRVVFLRDALGHLLARLCGDDGAHHGRVGEALHERRPMHCGWL